MDPPPVPTTSERSIPRPPSHRQGSAAPWAGLTAARRGALTLDLVRKALDERRSRSGLSHEPWPTLAGQVVGGSPAAVLVALFEEEGETHVVLTRRSFGLRYHRGEVALPGGRSDAGEAPIATALREAREEVGIAEAAVTPVGWLSPIVTFASTSAIWPVVGLMSARPTLVVDPTEVDRAFAVPLCDLLSDGAYLEERWRRVPTRPGTDADGYFPMYFYAVPGDVIWGATARVLTELLCLVTEVAWPDAQRVWA